jgi:hypothetical protein
VPETDLSQIVSVLTKIAEALNRLATIAEEQEKRQSGGKPFAGFKNSEVGAGK